MQLSMINLALHLTAVLVASAGSHDAPALRGGLHAAGITPVPGTAPLPGTQAAASATSSHERNAAAPADGRQAFAELRAVTGELRTMLVSELPALLNATGGSFLPTGPGGAAGPGAEIFQAATLLQADVARVLPAFLDAITAVEEAGREQQQLPLVALKQVADELRRTVTRRFLPAFLSAARDFIINTTGPMLHASANSIELELAALAEILAYFVKRSGHADWPNAPACVSDVASGVADLVRGAQQFEYSLADCEGIWRSPLDCAGDVAFMLQRFADASSLIGDAAFDCGGNTRAGCQESTTSAYSSLVSAASQGVVATADCVWPLSPGLASVEWCEAAVMAMVAAFEEFGEHSLEAAQLCGPVLDQAATASLERIAANITEEVTHVLPRIESALQDLQG